MHLGACSVGCANQVMMPSTCDAENLGSSTNLLFLRAARMTFRAFRPRYCASIPPLCALSPAAQANHSWMFLLGTRNPFTLKQGDNVSSTWESKLSADGFGWCDWKRRTEAPGSYPDLSASVSLLYFLLGGASSYWLIALEPPRCFRSSV